MRSVTFPGFLGYTSLYEIQCLALQEDQLAHVRDDEDIHLGDVKANVVWEVTSIALLKWCASQPFFELILYILIRGLFCRAVSIHLLRDYLHRRTNRRSLAVRSLACYQSPSVR